MTCIDTHILIWGVRGWASPAQEAMIPRTKRCIEHLAQSDERVMIPTPVVAEYLVGLPTEDHEAHLAILERNFFLPPLDVASAQLTASLLRNPGDVKGIRDKHGVDRQSLRTDAMIIAIAIVHGASKIVTHAAKHYHKLAKALIQIESIPEIQEQSLLFDA